MTTNNTISLPLADLARAIVQLATDELIDAQGPDVILDVYDNVELDQGPLDKYEAPLYLMMWPVWKQQDITAWKALREAVIEQWDQYLDDIE